MSGTSSTTSRCGEWSGARLDLITGEVRAGAIWCKSWLCEFCFPKRLKQLQAQAANGNPDMMFTFTSRNRSDTMTPDQAARELVHAVRMMIQRGKREGRFKDFQYIAVFEMHKSGWPHLHLLARSVFIPQKWLSERMAEYCDGPNVWVRRIKNASQAAWYVAKYCSKAPQRFQGCKRYWRTLTYDQGEKPKERPLHDHRKGFCYDWKVGDLAEMYNAHGYTLDWSSENSFIAWPAGLDLHATTRNEYWKKRRSPYKDKAT